MIDEVMRSQSWKKGKNNSSKVLTTQDFMLKQQEKYINESNFTEDIIDMRGETSGYAEFSPATDLSRPKLGQELLYNLNLTIETVESSVDKSSRTLFSNKKSIETLSVQRENLARQIANDQPKVDNLSDLFAILNRVHDRLLQTPDKVGIDDIVRLLNTLHEQYTEEFKLFGLITLFTGLSDHILVELFGSNWNPFLASTIEELHDFMRPWNNYIEALKSKNELSLASQAGKLLGEQLVKYMVPVTSRILINDWSVTDQPNECAAILNLLHDIIPFHAFHNFINSIILPKLTSAVEQWSPSSDVSAAHLWIHPFLPYLGNSLAVLYPDIRRKFNQYFTKWNPAENNRALNMLVPWKHIFDDVSMENLLMRSIIPKLIVGMRGFVINPANQDIRLFQSVMEWSAIIAKEHMLCILLGEFFPKWLRTLSFWLQNSAPNPSLYKDVRVWYLGWKSMFPEHFFDDEEFIKNFSVALDMLDATMDGRTSELKAIGEYIDGYYAARDYFYFIKLKLVVPEGNAAHERHSFKAASASETFKDLVEKFATDNDIDFFLTSRVYNNNHLYAFGKCSIYFDNNVVYKRTDDHSDYEPVGLESLLASSML